MHSQDIVPTPVKDWRIYVHVPDIHVCFVGETVQCTSKYRVMHSRIPVGFGRILFVTSTGLVQNINQLVQLPQKSVV